jgi:hypothetical protein
MPSFIKDEEKWEKAKEIARKEYKKNEKNEDEFWSLVMGIYKKMNGEFKKRLKKKK